MLQSWPPLIFSLAIALLGAPLLAASDQTIRVEVGRVAAVPFDSGTPELLAFKLTYDAQFTNQSEVPVYIPDPNKGPDGAFRIAFYSLRFQQADGAWRYVVDPGMLAWKGDTQFAPCRSLGPKETLEIKNLQDPFSIREKQLTAMGSKPTVRIALVLVCRQQDGVLVSTTLETDPFVLSMSERQ